MLVGGLWLEPGEKIYNAVFLLQDGKIAHITCKHNLPNYGVFDEKRVFEAAPTPEPILFNGIKLGVMICEDTWNINTAKNLKKNGAEILISLNASPFEADKSEMETAKMRGSLVDAVEMKQAMDMVVSEVRAKLLNNAPTRIAARAKSEKKEGAIKVIAKEEISAALLVLSTTDPVTLVGAG